MYYVHPAGAPPLAHASGLPVLLWLGTCMTALVVMALRGRRSSDRVPRACPMCAAVAVRTSTAEETGGGLLHLRLQCGQCGTWRRGLFSAADIEACDRALKRDRRQIGEEAVRLVRRRARGDLVAFTRALRSEVIGAEDFLARAGPSLPRRRGRR